MVLVATKSDLRNDTSVISQLQAKGKSMVSRDEGERLAKEIGASAHLECSALTQEGLKHVFDTCIRSGIEKKLQRKKKHKSKQCIVL